MTIRVRLQALTFPMLTALLLGGFACPSTAYADSIPVSVTSGFAFLSVTGGDELSFAFALPGIGPVWGYTAEDQGLHAWSYPAPPSLAPMPPYTPSSTATFSSGQIMLEGVGGPVIPAWRVSGDFAFSAGTGVLVPRSLDWGTEYVATAPFSFTGTLNQYDWESGAQLHTFLLSGSGSARGYVFNHWGPQPFVGYLSYDFTAPQPVPEPGTLLLVAGGLAAALTRRTKPGRVSQG